MNWDRFFSYETVGAYVCIYIFSWGAFFMLILSIMLLMVWLYPDAVYVGPWDWDTFGPNLIKFNFIPTTLIWLYQRIEACRDK